MITLLTSELNRINQGCRKDLGAYMEIPKAYEDCSEKIRNKYAYSVDVICGNQDLCPVCKASKKYFLLGLISQLKEEIKHLTELEEAIRIQMPWYLSNRLIKIKADLKFYEDKLKEMEE
jgi:hypothetical protein